MKLKILAIVLLAFVGLGAAFVAMGGLPATGAATTDYLTSQVATGDVSDEIAATGTVAPASSYGLAFGVSPHEAGAAAAAGSSTWKVTAVSTQLGATVKAGDVLATADTTDLKRQLETATDNWRVARIQLTMAEETLDDASGTDEIRQANIGLYNAQAQVSTAQATRSDLATQIALSTLTAPIDGVVTSLAIAVGMDAPSGDAVVIDSTDFQVSAEVVESDLASIQLGQVATVTVAAVGSDITGTVSAISPTASEGSGSGVVSYPVTVTLTDAPATVRSGMTADVTITTASAEAVLNVPIAALRGTAGAYTVLVMGPDGQPTSQAVEVGLVTSSAAEITSGLTVGQTVVTGVSTAQTGTTTTTGGFGGGGIGIPGGGGGGFQPGGPPRQIDGN
jgi:macrolide-specific efflux system membrane fusion protein